MTMHIDFRPSLVALALAAITTGCSSAAPRPADVASGAEGCTEEAKVCPDGSTVARQGPSCEFAPCPGEGEPGDGGADGTTACTEEAKVCPDGSSVSRQGPNCEFAPCPEEGDPGSADPGEDAVACTQDAKACPDGSYVSRQGPNCEFAPCPGQ